jgi:four helix bundle suffix protein
MKELILPHGGYRKLRSFQVAQLAYDATAAFCDAYIDRRSRTHDQMVQAARSGVQNIAEGSVASGTSKKTELKLTNVARASLEELRLDYEDFLRQRGLPLWMADDPRCRRIREARPATLDELRRLLSKPSDWSDRSDSSDPAALRAERSANAILCLINQASALLARQLARLEADFLDGGGFTERLYRERAAARRKASAQSD